MPPILMKSKINIKIIVKILISNKNYYYSSSCNYDVGLAKAIAVTKKSKELSTQNNQKT